MKSMFLMFLRTLTDLCGHIKETEELHGDFLNPSICDFGCLHSIILHYSNAVSDIKVIIFCFWPAFNLYTSQVFLYVVHLYGIVDGRYFLQDLSCIFSMMHTLQKYCT